VIDVSHDRDDRRAVLEQIHRFLGDDFRFLDDFDFLVEAFVLVAFFAFENESVDLTDSRGDFRFQRLIGCRKDTDLDQVRHDIERLQPKTGGQIGNQDWGLDDDQLRIIGNLFLDLGFDNDLRGGGHDRGERRGSDFRGLERGLIFFVEQLGNGSNDRFAGPRGLANLRLLVFGKKIERVGLLLIENTGGWRNDLSLLALALTTRWFRGRIEKIEDLGFLGRAVAIFGHPACLQSSRK